MNKITRFILNCAVILAFSPPSWASGVPEIEFIESVEEFQFDERGEEADEQIRKILGLTSKTAVVHVDWSLGFSGEQDVNDCENGRVTDFARPYHLPMNLVSTHIVLSVIPGSPLSFPFNSVSCVMSGGDNFVIRIKGFYVLSQVNIPTANNVEMRPVSPFEFATVTVK